MIYIPTINFYDQISLTHYTKGKIMNHFLYIKLATSFFCMVFVSFAYTMRDSTRDLESGSEITHSYGSLQQATDHINPVNRKRSPWTNFYTVAGMLVGTGITAATTWHFATKYDSETISDSAPAVYIAGTCIASFGVCCYFTTHGVAILHNTCRKLHKTLTELLEEQQL